MADRIGKSENATGHLTGHLENINTLARSLNNKITYDERGNIVLPEIGPQEEVVIGRFGDATTNAFERRVAKEAVICHQLGPQRTSTDLGIASAATVYAGAPSFRHAMYRLTDSPNRLGIHPEVDDIKNALRTT